VSRGIDKRRATYRECRRFLPDSAALSPSLAVVESSIDIQLKDAIIPERKGPKVGAPWVRFHLRGFRSKPIRIPPAKRFGGFRSEAGSNRLAAAW
jgi:hypothetical protein